MNILPYFVTRQIVKVIGILPARMKRMVFLASISAKAKHTIELDTDTLKKINDLFDLCGTEQSMKVPGLISKVIWNGSVTFDIERLGDTNFAIQEDTLQNIVNAIIEATPNWLKYGRTGDAAADLEKLFRNKTYVFG